MIIWIHLCYLDCKGAIKIVAKLPRATNLKAACLMQIEAVERSDSVMLSGVAVDAELERALLKSNLRPAVYFLAFSLGFQSATSLRFSILYECLK